MEFQATECWSSQRDVLAARVSEGRNKLKNTVGSIKNATISSFRIQGGFWGYFLHETQINFKFPSVTSQLTLQVEASGINIELRGGASKAKAKSKSNVESF